MELPTTTTTSDVESSLAYFDAYGEQSSLGYGRMRDLVVPGSPAWDYYFHQERLFIARNQVGGVSEPLAIKVVGDTIVACADAACASDTVYSDFEVRSGQLYTFAVEGREVSRLISTYPTNAAPYCWSLDSAGCSSSKSIDIVVRSVYRTANNDLYVTFDWLRGAEAPGTLRYDETTINGLVQPSTFVEVDGKKFICTDWATPVPEPGGFNVGYFGFTDPPLGSPVNLSIIMRWDGTQTDYDIPLGEV